MERVIQYKNIFLVVFVLFFTTFCVAQPPDYDPLNPSIRNKFNIRKTFDIRGDMLITGNNILGNHVDLPDNNTSIQNASINMVWVDVDGDPTTRNSSSAKVTIPTCAKVIYAGLYWAATYRYETNSASSGRFNDWNTVKFKVPSGSYVTLTADDILYDGFGDLDPAIQPEIPHKPYSCYKDVTNLLSPTNPNGDYFVGNIRVSKEGVPILNNQNEVVSLGFAGGACGGWSLVVVYEKLQLPSKKITTFDGHAIIKSGMPNPLNVAVSGFETLPYPEPVKARIGVMALDGDFRLKDDELRVKAGTASIFTPLQNPGEAVTNNFFNSSVTLNGVALNAPADRNPNSINTLGWDSHLNRIPQNNNIATPPINPIIPNGATAATIQLTTDRDKYDVFFTSFDVEVIAPKIPLIKTITNLNGTTNIDGVTLQLGQEFFYTLDLINIGNDGATFTTITDILPQNIVFPTVGNVILSTDVLYDGLPMSTTPSTTTAYYIYNPVTKTFVFKIPNKDLKIGGKHHLIKIKARSPIDCNDLVNACSNVVVNQASISYLGDQNTSTTPFGDASGNGLNACETPNPGATNFLLNVEACTYTKTEVLCGTTLLLTAPNGYTGYIWTNSNGVQIGTTQTITVNAVGIYQVQLITNNPCKTIVQTITVVNFNNTASTNPLLSSVDETVICPNNGIQLGKIYLCGTDDFQLIQTGITGASSIIWQKLISCTTSTTLPNLCPNTSTTCSWSNVGTGANFTASIAGQYRVIVNYQNGCFREFYFNVYKNVLNPTITPKDIVCTTQGSITISDIPNGYEYSLSPTGPFSTTNPIPITIAGTYTVYIRQAGIVGACPFVFSNITILNKQMSVSIVKKNKICNNGFGNIQVQINGVNAQYTYQLSQGATIIQNTGPINPNEYTFSNLNPGTYTVTCSTNQGCLNVQTIEILGYNMTATAAVTQQINCNGGTIVVAPTGGLAPYTYAIYSYNGAVVNPANYVFQNTGAFNIPVGQQGAYQFIVFDDNVICSTLTNTVTITSETTPTFTATPTNITCNGLTNGSIVVTSSNVPSGYTVEYSLDGITYQSSNTFSPYPVGNYTVYIKVKNVLNVLNECIYQATATIAQPDPLVGTSHLVQQKTCLVNGTIEAMNVTGGTAPFQYSINGGVNYQTIAPTNVFTNLGIGTFTIIIKDAKGCTYTTAAIEITDAIAPTGLTITNTAVTCPSLTTSIIATVVGGTAPFTYQIISPSIISPTTTTLTNATFSGLAVGTTYTIKVTDSKGCTYQENKNIPTTTPITITGNVTSNVQCFGTATGSATFTVGGFNSTPTATYSYTINNGTPILNQTATTISLTNLAAGSYKVDVTDNQTNCSATITVIVIAPPSALTLLNPVTPKTCVSNGSVSASATGGWGSYQFTLTQPDLTLVGPQNSGTFGNLSQTGTYSIKVVDANNCEVINTFTISNATGPQLQIDTVASNLCISGSNGASITVVATNGTSPYQYQNNTGAIQNSPTFNNLIAGTYTIKVIDSFGCENTVTQIINPALTAQATLTKALDCSLTPAATITVAITGGLAAYQYQVNYNTTGFGALNNVTGSSFTYTTSTAGNYQFKIIDASGCFYLTSIQIPVISNPNIISVTQTPPDCNGGNNGTLTINIDSSLGTGPFMYSINNGTPQSNPFFPNLIAGTYTINVKDSKECFDSETIVLLQPDPLLGQSALVQPITCSITTGTIQAINVSGGNGGYQYSINGIDFQGNPVFSGLSAGDYTIIIKDSKNCSLSTAMITLSVPTAPTAITLTPSLVSCPNLTTSITATAVGGLAPYTYQIISPNVINPSNILGNAVTFDNLSITATTTFSIKVTDANGCTYQNNITVPNINKIAVTGIVNTQINCLNDNNGQVTYTVSGFTNNYSYSINNGTVITNQTNPTLVLPTLTAGNYEINVTDLVTNCTATTIVTIPAPASLLVLNAPFIQPTCSSTGSVNATATGGWGTYEYSLQYPSGTIVTQNSGLFSGLLPNVLPYTISVKDINGCEKSQNFTLVPYTNPTISIDTVNSDFCYDTTNAASVTVTATGGVPVYQFQIKLGSSAYGSLQTNPLFANLSPGTYTIKVVDANGCFDEITQVIAPQLLAQATITKNIDCSLSPEATITLEASGGVAPYQYQVKYNTNPFGALTVLTPNPLVYSTTNAGDYQFQIVDAAGCIVVSNVLTINPIANPEITSITQLTNLLCFGDTTASFQVNPNTTVGLSPFKYSLDGITFQDSAIFPSSGATGLGAGTYTVTIKDANQCTNTKSITINEPTAINFTLSHTDLTCSGIPGGGNVPGSITVSNVSGGTPAYSYILKNETFQVITTFNPVANENHTFIAPDVDFGIYNVEVVDANGCSKSIPVTIASPPNSLIATNATVSCLTGATVDVTVLAAIPSANYVFGILTQSTSPYSLSFQPATIPAGVVSTFTNLVPGQSYTFVVRDLTTNCYFIQDTSTVIPPTSLVAINNVIAQNVTCFGSSNGSISFELTNFAAGTTSVNYEIFQIITNATTGFSGSQLVASTSSIISVPNFAVLPAGNYYFLIKESGGCTKTQNFTIEESNQLLEVNASFVKNDTCQTPAGLVAAFGQFGTPPYQFEILLSAATAPTVATWSSSGSSPFTVATGNYIVYVKDANNCIQASAVVAVGQDAIPAISLTLNNTCVTENNFALTVTRSPATIEPYTYSVDGNLPFTNNSLSFIIPNLSSGVHTVKVTDGNGCSELVTDQINIIPNAIISAPIKVQPSCALVPDGEIHVTATNGSGSYTYTINTTPTPTINITGDFTGLAPGSYTITVTDTTTNCDYFVTTALETPTAVDFSLIKQEPTCNGANNGVIEVLLNPLNANNPDYTYTLSAPGFTTVVQVGNSVFSGLLANTYQVKVESGRGCEKILPITLTDPILLSANDPNSYSFVCNNNVASSITINGLVVAGGTSPYSYSLDNINFLNLTNPSNISIIDNGLQQNITIYIKDSKGCTTQKSYVINPLLSISNPLVNLITPLSCMDNEKITISFTGDPLGNYSWQLLPSTTTTAFTGTSFTTSLPTTGQFTFQINDAAGCNILVNHTVLPYTATVLTANPVQNIDCYNDAIGQFNFSISNYSGTIDYEIYGSPLNNLIFSTTNAIAPFASPATLSAGNYYVKIKEKAFPFCQLTSGVITISSPAQTLSIVLTPTNDRDCLTDTGTILATISGGTAPYQYQLSNSGGIVQAFSSDNYFENFAAGSYTVSVVDAKGCATSDTITIGLDPKPEIILSLNNPCAIEGQFEIKVTRNIDGIAPYTYVIDGNAAITQNSSPFTIPNLLSGLHSVKIIDANGCGEPQLLTITPKALANVTIVSQPSCTTGGSIKTIVTGGTGPFSYSIQNSLGTTILTNNTGIFSDPLLVPGINYTVTVTDANLNGLGTNCTTIVGFNLEVPTPVMFSLVTTQPTCSNTVSAINNGSINVILATGNNDSPFTYTLTDGINPAIIQINNSLFTGLAGSASGIVYTVKVTSERGCTDTQTTTLTNTSPLSVATIIPEVFDCGANTSLTITVPTPTGGTPPYLYSFNGSSFSTLSSYNVVDTGNIQDIIVAVRDDKTCEVSQTVRFKPLNNFIVAKAIIDHLTCNSSENITLTITGTSSYTYQLEPSGTAILVPANNIIPITIPTSGNYVYKIVDTATGCFKIIEHTILLLQIFDVVATAGNSLNCFGDTNGTLSATVNGYSGNFTYDIVKEDGTIFTSGTNNPIAVSGLSVGNYTVHVTIPNTSSYIDCTKTSNIITISSPPIALTLTIAQTADVTCNPLIGGTITVTNTIGGTAPYQYQLLAMPTGNVLTSFTNLPAGDYKVIVRDANLCEASQLITLLAPTPITVINPPTITNQLLKCYNVSNASVTITGVSGGQGGYQYTLTNLTTGSIVGPIPNNTFTNLGVANYTVVVTDGWECSSVVIPFTISQPTEIIASLSTSIQATCTSLAQITITASGGTPPYKYSTDNITYTSFSGTNTTFTVPAGTYQYYITDANNCKTFQTNEVKITPVTPIVLTLNENTVDINCAGQTTASIQATATFGFGGYLYSVINATTLAVVRAPQPTGYFTNFGAGSYLVKVTGNGGCTALAPFTVTEPTALLVGAPTVKQISCFGKNDGKITLNVSQGTLDYQFGASPNIAQTSNVNVFDNLGTGTYTFLIQDAKGCFQTITSTITEPPLLTALTPVLTDELCEGTDNGTATITIIGGTGPYKWSFNDDTPSSFIQLPIGVTSFIKTGLSGGQQYIFYVLDKNNCPLPITINTKPAIALNPSVAVAENCVNNIPTNSISVTMTPDYPNEVQYSINNGISYQFNNVFSGLAPGDYKIKVKHANGCTKETATFHINQLIQVQLTAAESGLNQVTATATNGQAPYTYIFNGENTGTNNVYFYTSTGTQEIAVIDALGCQVNLKLNTVFYDLEIPNFFTPNGSGINDGWTPLKIDNLKNIKTSIFDRYGRELKILKNGESWDGTYRGNEVPSGDYWYLVEVNDSTGRTFVGNFTLYR